MKFYFKCFMFLLLLLFFTIRLHFNLKNNKKNCDIFDDPYDPYFYEDEDDIEQPNYYDNWESYEQFKCINVLKKNINIIRDEMKAIKNWRQWPEIELYNHDKMWTVFPFLHTFPATNPEKSNWIKIFCDKCPKTVKLLKTIPGIRTALLSRMGPNMVINPHQGWAELSNYVLRFHLALEIPGNKCCGVWVRGEKRFHVEGEIICFDDSKIHKAFNLSDQDRTVLIFDIIRPDTIPLGTSKVEKTDELNKFINYFQKN